MKSLAVFVFVVALIYALSPEDLDKIKAHMMTLCQECQAAEGATGDDIGMIMQKKAPTTKQGKCFLFCMHKKMNFQDASGKLNMPGVNAWISSVKQMDADLAGKVQQLADICIPTINDSGDGCDTAVAVFECYTKTSQELGFEMPL